MTDDTPKFERDEYGDIDQGQSASQYQVAANDLLVKPHCSTDSCTSKVEEPAEAAWVKLMSAVPQASQINNLRAGREGTMMLPEGHTIQSMVASIRPQPEADYALDTIRDEWIDFYEEFRIIGPKLEQGLSALSAGWKGADYDGFEEQTETVIKNCRTIQNDIGGEDGADGIIALLDTKQSEIFEQQGGTACVYPAPKFYMEGTSCGSHRIHIRPPYFKNCVIEENDEIKHAVELAGFDPTVVDEVQEGRQQTYDRWMEYVTNNPDYEQDGLKGEQLAQSKADEYADRRLVAMGAKGSEQLEEQAALVNEEVTERHSNVEAQVTEIEPDAGQSEPTTFTEGMPDIPGGGDLDIGDGGGMPDLGDTGGLDGMGKPTDLSDLGSGGLDGPGGLNDAGGLGNVPGGGGAPPGGYSPDGGLNVLNDENPFSSGLEDPDDLGGRLPGDVGGGSGLTGTGLNSGGLPPSDYTGGNGLSDLDSDPWSAPPTDPDDLSGGLASGGGLPGGSGGAPPTGVGGGGGLPGAGGGLTGIGGGKPPSYSTGRTRNPINAGSGADKPKGVTGRGLTGSGRPGSFGGAPGSTGRAGGLGGVGSGSGAPGGGRGGVGGGMGGGRGAMPGGGGATAAGRGGVGAPGMIGSPGGGGQGGEDDSRERKVWMVEDDEVWGGSPEDEDDDLYS
ncbi:MAG TPA: hypothetical protein VFU12_08245 [Glycomyces sp.]|nr:hypothetical protein [Glycomyces sp.]